MMSDGPVVEVERPGYREAVAEAHRLRAENSRLRAELESERERRRVFMCGYCGAEISRVEPGEAPGQEQVEAFAAHDAACPKNPLRAELEALIRQGRSTPSPEETP